VADTIAFNIKDEKRQKTRGTGKDISDFGGFSE
jgi:hypothetical protein